MHTVGLLCTFTYVLYSCIAGECRLWLWWWEAWVCGHNSPSNFEQVSPTFCTSSPPSLKQDGFLHLKQQRLNEEGVDQSWRCLLKYLLPVATYWELWVTPGKRHRCTRCVSGQVQVKATSQSLTWKEAYLGCLLAWWPRMMYVEPWLKAWYTLVDS